MSKLPETSTGQLMAVDHPRLVGRLVFAGDLEVNGEEISGCALDIDRPTLIAARALPMYEECIIVTSEELREMRTMVESLTRDLWTVIEVARRNMSKKHGTIERIAGNIPANAIGETRRDGTPPRQ